MSSLSEMLGDSIVPTLDSQFEALIQLPLTGDAQLSRYEHSSDSAGSPQSDKQWQRIDLVLLDKPPEPKAGTARRRPYRPASFCKQSSASEAKTIVVVMEFSRTRMQ